MQASHRIHQPRMRLLRSVWAVVAALCTHKRHQHQQSKQINNIQCHAATMNTQCPSEHNARSTSGHHRYIFLQLLIAVSLGHCRDRTRLCATTAISVWSAASVNQQRSAFSASASVQRVATADERFAHLMLRARQHYLLELWMVLLSSGCRE